MEIGRSWRNTSCPSAVADSGEGVLAFLARDAEGCYFDYANTKIRKKDQNDEVPCFVELWKERTGRYPSELVFDSRLTTYANLAVLNEKGFRFLTLRGEQKG